MGLLARPPGAGLGYRDLTGRGLGEKAVRAALKELDVAGYRHQVKLRSTVGKGRGGVGRFVTMTLTSDEPIDADAAAKWFHENRDQWLSRVAASAARYDQGKDGKATGRTVRRVPGRGIPGRGTERHLSTESQREGSLRSLPPDQVLGDARPQAPPPQRTAGSGEVCEHDVPVGVNGSGVIRCPQCRQRAELAAGRVPDGS